MAFGKMNTGSKLALLLAIGLTVCSSGCIESTKPSAQKDLATINVDGSSTVFLISLAMAGEFEKKFPDHKVTVSRSGTGGGYKKFVLRQCDLWNASRPVAEKEKTELKEKGIGWLELDVGLDGVCIGINPANDWCTELTVGQLRKIWEPDSKVTKWSDLNPQWPDQPMELYGQDTDSGTFEYFTEVINGKKNAHRTKYQAASDDNVLIEGIAGSKYSLGYVPYGYCVENKKKVKVIKVSPTIEETDTPAPAIEPTIETILSGEYKPLSRPLFVYANTDALKRPEVAEFLKFIVSEEGRPLVAQQGFVQIPEERRKEMVERLDAALKAAGTDK